MKTKSDSRQDRPEREKTDRRRDRKAGEAGVKHENMRRRALHTIAYTHLRGMRKARDGTTAYLQGGASLMREREEKIC